MRGDIKRFREYLNVTCAPNGNPDIQQNHKHGRYEQRTRQYGDYIYHQDRDKFDFEMAEWIAKGRPNA